MSAVDYQTLTCLNPATCTDTHTHTHTDTANNNFFFTSITLEETLDAEVGNCKAQHRQLVQLGDDIRGERQQAGQPVQLSIQPVPVPLGRVGFLTGGGRLPDDEMDGKGERDIWSRAGVRVCVYV